MTGGPLRAELERTNYAGRTVTLAEGAAVVGATTLLSLRAGRADALMIGAIGALGLADDLIEPRRRRAGLPVEKGLRGHLGALRRGRLTTGAAKAIGIPVVAGIGALLAPGPRRPVGMVVDAGIAAGSANLVNLLDLRPGRALKVVLPAAALLAVVPARAGAEREARERSGAALALAALLPGLTALPADLRERGMLGDAGANALGAATGAAAARRLPAPARVALLAGIVALTAASEKVSFSAVIDRTATLRRIDRWGRRPLPGDEGTR